MNRTVKKTLIIIAGSIAAGATVVAVGVFFNRQMRTTQLAEKGKNSQSVVAPAPKQNKPGTSAKEVTGWKKESENYASSIDENDIPPGDIMKDMSPEKGMAAHKVQKKGRKQDNSLNGNDSLNGENIDSLRGEFERYYLDDTANAPVSPNREDKISAPGKIIPDTCIENDAAPSGNFSAVLMDRYSEQAKFAQDVRVKAAVDILGIKDSSGLAKYSENGHYSVDKILKMAHRRLQKNPGMLDVDSGKATINDVIKAALYLDKFYSMNLLFYRKEVTLRQRINGTGNLRPASEVEKIAGQYLNLVKEGKEKLGGTCGAYNLYEWLGKQGN